MVTWSALSSWSIKSSEVTLVNRNLTVQHRRNRDQELPLQWKVAVFRVGSLPDLMIFEVRWLHREPLACFALQSSDCRM